MMLGVKLLLLVACVTQVLCEIQVSLLMQKYENTNGTGANGHCCDGKWGVCQKDGCDHRFYFCLDNARTKDASTEEGHCRFGRVKTDAIINKDNITFGSMVANLRNPVLINSTGNMPDAMDLKIQVLDSDSGLSKSDLVDNFQQTLQCRDRNGRLNNRYITLNLRNHTKLDALIKFDCAPDFYGRYCDVRCPKPARNMHYVCNATTGNKDCKFGWKGINCTLRDPCATSPCLRDAQCTYNSNGRAMCTCPDEYGFQCKPQYRSFCNEMCHPGTCEDYYNNQESFSYQCKCPRGFTDEVSQQASVRCTRSRPTKPSSGRNSWVNRRNADCDTLALNGMRYKDGVYELQPGQGKPFRTYCEMSTEGWTVIMNRVSDDVDFNRGWQEYKDGFGQPGELNNFWVGLDNIYALTNQRKYKLRIQMQLGNLEFRYANYGNFWIDGEDKNYTIHINDYTGDAGDAFHYTGKRNTRYHDGMPFSTKDRDNDKWPRANCAKIYKSGWWFNDCYWVNLNGPYVNAANGWPQCIAGKCIRWSSLPEFADFSLRKVQMKIFPQKRNIPEPHGSNANTAEEW